MESFKKLNLSDNLIKALQDAGFTEPSEIQEKVIPLAVAGHDVIGSASTGSGKTLAFGAHILDEISKRNEKGTQALIIAPTRELSEQISQSLMKFSRYMYLHIAPIYGGVAYYPQVRALKKCEIIVGTPGRLLDHINEGTLDLSKLKFLVLDEADRMLDMGFIRDIDKIISKCPKDRQTLLLSATMTPDIAQLAQKYMRHPKEVDAVKHVDPSKLKQIFYDTPQDMKFSLLVHLLKNEQQELVMVFCNTRRNADLVVSNLKRYEINALAIHGGLSQNKRNNTLEQFHAQNIRVLVCTDVAARGLDIKGVSHVYNYDIPKSPKEYVHRIGRTARAGTEGMAINIVSPHDSQNFREVMRDESLNIELVDMPIVQKVLVSFKRRENERRGFRRGNYGRDSGRSYGRRDFRRERRY